VRGKRSEEAESKRGKVSEEQQEIREVLIRVEIVVVLDETSYES